MEPKVKVRPTTDSTEKFKEPDEYKVILLNDHYTTMDFVVEILVVIFRKTVDEAAKIMMNVHNKGKGVAGIYTWDIAVTKIEQVHEAAKASQFPLRCTIEPA